MADIKQVVINNTTYNLKDSVARDKLPLIINIVRDTTTDPETVTTDKSYTDDFIPHMYVGGTCVAIVKKITSTQTSEQVFYLSSPISFSDPTNPNSGFSANARFTSAFSFASSTGNLVSISGFIWYSGGNITFLDTVTQYVAVRLPSAKGTEGQMLVANASGNLIWQDQPTIPTVPTNVSSFTNDAGYLTLATLPIYDGTVV